MFFLKKLAHRSERSDDRLRLVVSWHNNAEIWGRVDRHKGIIGVRMLDPTLFPQAVNTILITRLDGLDDVVLGTMLLSGLHRRWPGAYIKILVRPELAG